MTAVTPAERYWFKVAAKNLVGKGSLSDSVSRIAASVPAAPLGLELISQSTTSITFSWSTNANDGGSPVTDYQIFWNQGSGSIQYEVIGSNGLSPTQATIQSPTLLADKNYLFWVKARNAVGTSAYSAQISIHSASLPGIPGSPFRISTTTQTQVVVGWTINPSSDFGGSQLLGYEVWWNQGPLINTYVKYGDVNAATFNKIVSPVTTSSNYKFYIIAKNIVGSSVPSSTVQIWAAIVPNAPVNLQRVVGTNAKTTIKIEWTKAYNGGSTITGYQVWWNHGGSGPVTEIKAVINTDITNYLAEGLTAGQNYGFAVKAINVVGSSDLSTLKVIMSATVPEAPSTPVMVS